MPATESQKMKPDPLKVPLYTFMDAVRYLHLPVQLLQTTTFRVTPDGKCLIQTYWSGKHLEPPFYVSSPREEKPYQFSFQELADLFVRSFALNLHRIFDGNDLPYAYPFFSPVWPEGLYKVLFVDPFARKEPLFGKTEEELVEWLDTTNLYPKMHLTISYEAKLKLASMYLSRVDVEDGMARRLYPFTQILTAHESKSIVIDPHKRFGQPSVSGIPTEVLNSRFHSGDSVEELAEDYGIDAKQVEEALRYASTMLREWPGTPIAW